MHLYKRVCPFVGRSIHHTRVEIAKSAQVMVLDGIEHECMTTDVSTDVIDLEEEPSKTLAAPLPQAQSIDGTMTNKGSGG